MKRLHIPLCLLLTSCTLNGISVHSDYLSHQNLASYHVGTPDPLLNNPPVGQRLIVSWSVKKCFLNDPNLHITLTVRFRSREEIQIDIPIKKIHGNYVYSLLNEDYFNKKGILTYKADLLYFNTLLEEWKHQMWTELISFADESKKEGSPQIDTLLSSPESSWEKQEQQDPNYPFEETTLPKEFRLY